MKMKMKHKFPFKYKKNSSSIARSERDRLCTHRIWNLPETPFMRYKGSGGVPITLTKLAHFITHHPTPSTL